MSTQATVVARETPTLNHFIGGKQVVGASGGRSGVIFDPSTGRVTAHVSFASAEETRAAVKAARNALPAWAQTPPLQRARVLFRFKALLDEHLDELARIITSEHGKVLSDARGEVTRGLEVVEFACGIPQLLKGEFSDSVGRGIDSWSLRQAVGDVDVPDRHRLRQYVRPQAVGKGPFMRPAARRTAERGGLAARRAQCRERRSRGGRYAAHGPRRRRGELCWFDARRPTYI